MIEYLSKSLKSCYSFIVDGRRLKSINQHYNKRISQLQSIKDKQKIKGYTNKMYSLTNKHNHRINYYIHKSARIIIDYCLEHKISTIIIGYNDNFQCNVNMGKINNQKFTYIPFGKLRNNLQYLCKMYGINNQKFTYIPFGKLRNNLQYLCKMYGIKYYEIEESYTSKASFFDNDDIPTLNADKPADYNFSGKRIKRGLYQTATGYIVNADVNGALNIMKKCIIKRKLTDINIDVVQCKSFVNEPVRIRLY